MLAFLVVALGGVSLALPERAEAAMADCFGGCWPYCPSEQAADAQCSANCPNYAGTWGCRVPDEYELPQGGSPCPSQYAVVCHTNIT
jgi:hypothetical protein